MKKIITLLAFFLLATSAIFAQVNLLTQSFESLPYPPAGWSNVRITGPSFPGNWARYGNGVSPVQTPHTGAWQIRFNSANFGAGTSGELRTAILNFTTAGTHTVSFWMYRDNWVGNDKLEVFVNTAQTSVGGTLLGTINRDRAQSPVVGTNGWYQYSFSIPSTFNTATNYIIFKATSAFGKDIYVDDISVDRYEPSPPGCITTFAPANGVVGLCTNTTLSWGIVPLASGYKITLGTNAPDYNNILNNVDLGVALNYVSIFNPNTTYGWKLIPYNGFGAATDCLFNTFTTGLTVCYGVPIYLEGSCGSEDFIDDFSTTGGITNISSLNTGCTTNAFNYTYFAGQTVTVIQGNSFDVSMQSGPDFAEGFAVWIDYNIDGDFNDPGEYVFNAAGPTIDIVNGTVTVPYSATVGLTRMRVRCAYNYVPTSGMASATLSEGETQDYDIQINPCLTTTTYFADADGDTYGNALASLTQCAGAAPPVGYVLNSTDCNDTSATTYPGAAEICNGLDDDCNGSNDEGLTFINYYLDSDVDGYGNIAGIPVSSCGPLAGYVSNNTDCNDGNAAINPGAAEVCNGIDDNCNGSNDEGLTYLDYYTDADADGFGNIFASPVNSCTSVIGAVTNNTDCNDSNPNIKPGAPEICNGIDDNCNGSSDEGLTYSNYYLDNDEDGFGNPLATPVISCAPVPGLSPNNTDCNDDNGNIYPGAPELCNGIDDDCDASVDEGAVVAIISAAGPTTFCSGGTVLLQAQPGAGYSYQWLRNGANIPGANTANYTTNKTGNYQVKVTVGGGCLMVSSVTTVTVVAAPKATIITPIGTDLCGLASVVLKTNNGAGFTFQWIRNGTAIVGATSNIYSATTVGNYKVLVTNASGCAKTSAVTAVSKSCRLSEELENMTIEVFPNPVFDNVTIALQYGSLTGNQIAEIEIFNLAGQSMSKESIMLNNGELLIDYSVANWSAGLYIIKATCNGKAYTQQLVVTK